MFLVADRDIPDLGPAIHTHIAHSHGLVPMVPNSSEVAVIC